MYYLAEAIPSVRRFKIPLARDQVMLLMAASNLLILGLDHYLAHDLDGTIKPLEWIPIIFGPAAGVLLLIAGLVALRNRTVASVIGTTIFCAGIVIALLGTFFHFRYTFLLTAPAGQQVNVPILIWAPPLLGPLTFLLIAILGISAAWEEDPLDSGVLVLLGGRRLQMPYSKTRAYFFMVAIFLLATVISSVLDHARTGFSNPWLWLPTALGVFATVVTWSMGALSRLERNDIITFLATMLLMVIVGILGSWLHIAYNLTGQGAIIGERFLRGAPLMAPMLYADMGALGLIVLLNPKTEKSQQDS